MDLIITSVLRKTCGLLISKSIGKKPVCISRPQLQSVRFASGRGGDCLPDGLEPRCALDTLEKSPCMDRKKKEAAREKNPFKSLWDNPECCNDPCPHVLPRFDDLYYRISDKATRIYMQTWVECPKRKVVPRVICSYEKIKFSPVEKRKKGYRPTTACHAGGCGKRKVNLKCLMISSPGCKAGRVPPKCYINRRPSDCKKVCTPYPSFSECKKPQMKSGRLIECDCLRPRSQCSMFEYLRKQTIIKTEKSK